MKAIYSIVLISLTITHVLAQQVDTLYYKLETLAKLPKAVTEISGMVYTDHGFWVHNDSDNGAFIMLMTDKGLIKTVKKIIGATNYDWEDITVDQQGNLFIGDIGNNANTRRSLQIYKVPNPLDTKEMRINAETIEFVYPDQTAFPPKSNRLIYDAEAMVYFNDSIYIFNKNRTEPFDGMVRVYKVPAKAGKYKALLCDSIRLGGKKSLNSWITSATISKDGKNVALLSSDKIWVFSNFAGSNFFKGSLKVIKLNHFSQKEAICYNDQNEIFIADELFEKILGGSLYRIKKR
jgi:WD40 repeat protein